MADFPPMSVLPANEESLMMQSKWFAAVVVLCGMVGLVAAAADLSIDEIMTKAHKARTGLRDQIKNAAAMPNPDWAQIQQKTKEFLELAKQLVKNDPPKGDKASWEKYCADYLDIVKALDEAAAKKDARAIADVNKRLGASCKGCHDAHQP
jgi:cytochrome c556